MFEYGGKFLTQISQSIHSSTVFVVGVDSGPPLLELGYHLAKVRLGPDLKEQEALSEPLKWSYWRNTEAFIASLLTEVYENLVCKWEILKE